MIVYISDETQPAWRGYFYAGTIFVFAIIQSLLLHQYFHRCLIVGMRIRAGLVSAIYGKVCDIKISNKISFLWILIFYAFWLSHISKIHLIAIDC